MKRKEYTLVIKNEELHKNVTAGQLERFTDEDLTKELERRAVIKKELAREALIKRQSLIYNNVDTLLELVPEHHRTSCSDTNHFNHCEDCAACWLLFIKEDQGIFDNRELRFELKEN